MGLLTIFYVDSSGDQFRFRFLEMLLKFGIDTMIRPRPHLPHRFGTKIRANRNWLLVSYDSQDKMLHARISGIGEFDWID